MMKKYLKKTSIFYSATSVIKAGIQMLVGLAIAKFVTPADYGIWGTLSLILTYVVILQFGIVNGLNLELPLAMGRGDKKEAEELVQTAQSYIIACILFILLIGGTYLLFFGPKDEKYFYGIIGIIFMSVFTFYQDFITATFRTQESFAKLAVINLVHAAVNLVTILLIVYFFYYGLVLKSVIVLLVYVLFLHYHRPFKVKLKFDSINYKKLIKVGLPIFGLAYIQAIAISFDKLLLVKFSDVSSVGIYSFGYLAFASITMFSSSIASYIYPTMSQNYAKDRDSIKLWNYLRKNMTLVFIGLLIIATVGAAVVPFLVEIFFPKYNASIYVMQILFFAGVFNGSVIGVNVLFSMKKWRLIVIYNVVFSILLIFCPFIFMHFSTDKITAVAYGVLLANFLNLISGYILVYLGTVKSVDG